MPMTRADNAPAGTDKCLTCSNVADSCTPKDGPCEDIANKHYVLLVVSYESAGGMGEHDAIEEGLRGYIDNSHENMEKMYGKEDGCKAEDYRKFTVEHMESIITMPKTKHFQVTGVEYKK